MILKTLARLAAAAIAAVALAAPVRADNAALDYEAFTLDNGLKVILVEDRSAPVVAVDVWYHVGSANDPAGRSGFAHLFEHMMFQGTANLSKDDLQHLITDAGGKLNAYTGRDFTVYYEYLPSQQLPLALWLEADRMASLAVTQTNLDNQRAVVIQEYERSYGATPYGNAILKLLSMPLTYGPYLNPPIGNVDDLNQATIGEVTAFHDTYYVPNNATLVIAGDIDKDVARGLVEQYFSIIPAGAEPPALPEWQPQQQAEAEYVTIEDDLIRIPAVLIGYETPPRSDPDHIVIEVLDELLGTGASSRLQQDLVDTGDALNASILRSSNIGPGFMGFFLVPNIGGASREEVEQMFYDEIDRIIRDGVPQEELDKAINILRLDQVTGLQTAFRLAEAVQAGNANYGDPAAFLSELDRYRAVTSADIQRVVAEYFAPEDRHVIYVDPVDPRPHEPVQPFVGAVGDATDDAFAVDFALPFDEPPAPLEIHDFHLPTITQHVLANGLEVVVIEASELPIVSVDLVFRGGAALVPQNQAGLAGITSDLLTRGTSTRSAAEIANAIEALGGGTRSAVTFDFLSVGVFSLIEDRDFSFELLADMAFNPSFPEQELDVRKEQMRSALDAALVDPGAQAARAFSPAVYGDHPYGGLITSETVAAIDRQAVVDYYASMRQPDNAYLVVAGQITEEDAMALAEQYFGNWQATAPVPQVDFPEIEPSDGGNRIILVNVPGAEQAQVTIGNLTLRGDDPGRYPLSVVNAILGEGLSSRLSRVIREEKGYAYSISSNVYLPIDRGTFRIDTQLRNEVTGDAVGEILRVLDRIRTEPVPDDELAAVRGGMIGRFALNLESEQAFVNVVVSYKSRGIPLDDVATYPERIAATDAAAVLAAARDFIPANLVIIIAGDAEALLPQLEPIGEVTVVDPR